MKALPQRMTAALTFVLALSVILVGIAQAAGRPDNRTGIRGIGSQTRDTSDVFSRAVLRHNAAIANRRDERPDDRAGFRGAGTELADNAPIASATSTGFQWTDAGLGAAVTLALVLVIAGLAVARASHHRSHPILD